MADDTTVRTNIIWDGIKEFLRGSDQIEKGYQQVDKAAEKSADASVDSAARAEASAKRWEKTAGVMSTAGKAMLATSTALAGGMVALAMKSASLPAIGQAFEGMAGSVGLSLEALNQSAAGTISNFELMRTANVALTGAGKTLAVEFGQKLPAIMEIARASAKATGQDVGFLFQSLVTGVKRTSPMLIDNTGLQLKLGEANKALAEQLGKTTDELTGEEKQIAILNATVEAGGKIIESMGGMMGDTAEQTQSMGAQIKNLKDDIGILLLPTLSQGLDIITKFVNVLADTPGPLKEAAVKFTLVGTAVLGLGGAASLAGGQVAKLMSALRLAQAAMGFQTAADLTKAFDGMRLSMMYAREGGEGLKLAMIGLAGSAKALLAIIGPAALLGAVIALGVHIYKTEEAHQEESAAAAASAKTYREYADKLKLAGRESYTLSEALWEQVKALDAADQAAYAKELVKTQKEMQTLVNRFGRFNQDAENFIELMKKGDGALTDLDVALLQDADSVDALGKQMGLSGIEARNFTNEVVKLAQGMELTQEVASQMATMRDPWQEMASVTKEAEISFSRVAGVAEIVRHNLFKQKDAILALQGAMSGATGATDDLRAAQERLHEVLLSTQQAYWGYYSTLSDGILAMRDLDQAQVDAHDNYMAQLADLDQQASQVYANIGAKAEASLPNATTVAQRMGMAGDAWDEWALRIDDILKLGAESPWLEELYGKVGQKPDDVPMQEWLQGLKEKVLAGELLVTESGEGWKEYQKALSDAATEAEATSAREIAAINEKRAAADAAYQEELARQQTQREEQKVQLALQLADASGSLDAWFAEQFGGSMEAAGVTAEQVFSMIKSGVVDLGTGLDTVILGSLANFNNAMDTTGQKAIDNKAAIADLANADIQAKLDETAKKLDFFSQVDPEKAAAVKQEMNNLMGEVEANDPMPEMAQTWGTGFETFEEGITNAQAATTTAMSQVKDAFAEAKDDGLQPFVDLMRDEMVDKLPKDILDEWVGNSVLPDLTEAMQDMGAEWGTVLDDAETKIADNTQPAFEELARKIKEDGVEAVKDLDGSFVTLNKTVNDSISKFRTFKSDLAEIRGSVRGLVGQLGNLKNAFDKVGDAIPEKLDPIGKPPPFALDLDMINESMSVTIQRTDSLTTAFKANSAAAFMISNAMSGMMGGGMGEGIAEALLGASSGDIAADLQNVEKKIAAKRKTLAEGILPKGELGEVAQDLEELLMERSNLLWAAPRESALGIGGQLGGLGSSFAKLYKEQQLDPLMKDIKWWEKGFNVLLKERNKDENERLKLVERQKEILEEVNALTQEGMDAEQKKGQYSDAVNQMFVERERLASKAADLEEELAGTDTLRDYERVSKEIQDTYAAIKHNEDNIAQTRDKWVNEFGIAEEIWEEIVAMQQEYGENHGQIDELQTSWNLKSKDLYELQKKMQEGQKKYEEREKRILALQKAQADLDYLGMQFDLLNMIKEYGVSPNVLGGIQFGLDAPVEGFMDAMTGAMDYIVKNKLDPLIRADTPAIPGAFDMVYPTAAPGLPALPGGSTLGNQIGPTFNMGGNTINTPLDLASLEAHIVQVIRQELQ